MLTLSVRSSSPLVRAMVPVVAKSIVSAPGLALEAETASRSEPAPVSRRLVTVKVLGRQRSSRASTPSRGVRGRWGERRNVATDGRDFRDVSKERNHMGISLAGAVVCSWNVRGPPGAQTVRRVGAGPVGGLLGGKDPTGRCFANDQLLTSSAVPSP